MNKLPEIIRLIKENQVEVIKNMMNDMDFDSTDAEELFLMLFRYTNSFKNYNTNPELLRLTWETLKHWISHDKIIVEKNKRSLNEMRFYWKIIKTLKIYKNGLFAWFVVTKELMSEFGLKSSNINWFMFNLLSIISWTKFGFLLIENWENESILHIISKYESQEAEELRKYFWIDYENKVVNKNYKEILDYLEK